MQGKESNFQNILVIDLGQLGDVVLSLPALRAIRRHFSTSHIAILAGKASGEVVALSRLADEVIKIDRVELRDGPKLRSVAKIVRFVGEIRKRPTDLVIDLHSLPETNLLALLSKAKHRLLANRESRSLDTLSNVRPRPPKEDKTKHLSDRYLDVLAPLGISGAERKFVFRPSVSEQEFVNDLYFKFSSGRWLGLFPGAGHPSRCWPLENFAELADGLLTDGIIPVVFLGPEEKGIKEKVKDVFPSSAIIIEGLSLGQFVAAAARVDAFVTNDTGPMHLAACAGTSILLLLDKQAPLTYLPLTDRLEFIHDKAISEITVDEASKALRRLLNYTWPENDKQAATC